MASTEHAGRLEASAETGASAVEYALLGSMVAAVIAGVVATMGTQLVGLFTQMVSQWP